MASKYIDIFLREAEEHVTSLQKGLLILEKEPGNTALIHDLLRNAHTLKGSARMVGLEDISVIAHRMEDTLQDMEAGPKIGGWQRHRPAPQGKRCHFPHDNGTGAG